MNENLKSLVEKRAEEYRKNNRYDHELNMNHHFTAGALDPLITKAIRLEERTKFAAEQIDELLRQPIVKELIVEQSTYCKIIARRAERELRELLEGGK